MQIIQDYTNQHGILAWDAEAEPQTLAIEAVRKVDRFESAKHAIVNRKTHKPIPGEYFVPKVTLMEGAEYPTFREWVTKDI